MENMEGKDILNKSKFSWFLKRKNQVLIILISIILILGGWGVRSISNDNVQHKKQLYTFNATFESLTANMYIEQFTLDEGETKSFERNEFLSNVTMISFFLMWQDVQFVFPDEIRFKVIPPMGCNATFNPSNEVKKISNGFDVTEIEIEVRISEIPINTTVLAPSLEEAINLVNETYGTSEGKGIWSMEVECLGDGSMNLDTGQMDSYALFHYAEIFEGNVTEG